MADDPAQGSGIQAAATAGNAFHRAHHIHHAVTTIIGMFACIFLIDEVEKGLAGTGTERIRPDTPVFDSLGAAVEAAMAAAAPGDILLFSPAFASFGMFKNEYERNDQFMARVLALQ